MSRKFIRRFKVQDLEQRLTPTAGMLDSTYGIGGLVTTRLPLPSNDGAGAMVLDSSGRIVIAGSTDHGNDTDMIVARFLSDGSLDTSFAVTGIATITFNTGEEYASGVAIDSLGRIVVAGSMNNGVNTDFAVARLTPAGVLDTTFDVDGRQTIPFGDFDSARAVAIDSSDRIVVAGNGDDGSNYGMAIARLTVAGALDTSFDTDGKQLFPFANLGTTAYGMTLDSQGRIVVAGSAYNAAGDLDMAVVRLTSTGAPDNTFDTDGQQIINLGTNYEAAFCVAADSLDRVVLAGSTFNGTTVDLAIARLTTAGKLDTTFDSDGRQSVTFSSSDEEAHGIAIGAGDTVIVTGSAIIGTKSDVAVAKLTVAGKLDTTFDGDGRKTIALTTGDDGAGSVWIDGTGRLTIACSAAGKASDYDIALVRLSSVGAFDATFDSDGKLILDLFSESQANAAAAAIDGLNRVVLVNTVQKGLTSNITVTRYTANGGVDTGFGTGGTVTTNFGAYSTASDVAVDSMNRIVVIGLSSAGSGSVGVVRLTPTGSLDTTFDTDGKASLYPGATVYSVAIDSVDRIIVAGYYYNGFDNDFAVARLTAAGTLDPSFGSGGTRTFGFSTSDDIANSVAVDSADRILVAGYVLITDGFNNNTNWAIARLTTSGSLDTNFDTDGKQTIDSGVNGDYVRGISVDSQDRPVIGGIFGPVINFAVARLTNAGKLDTTFDSDGKQAIPIGASGDTPRNIAVDVADRPLLIGWTNIGSDVQFAVARLTTAGALDITFDTDGKQTVGFGMAQSDKANDLVIDSVGRIVLVGTTAHQGTEFALARLTGDNLPPPTVTQVAINGGDAQRSRVTTVAVTFSQHVTLPVPPEAAFKLERHGDTAMPMFVASPDDSGSTTVVTLTFFGTTAVEFESLADGRYTLTVKALEFASFDGNADGIAGDDYILASAGSPNPPTNIFRLFGDINGDGSVGVNDFNEFRASFGGTNAAFDVDNDGSVAISDFNRFRMQFGATL